MSNKTSFYVNKFNIIPIDYIKFQSNGFPPHYCEEDLPESNLNPLEAKMHTDKLLLKDIREFKKIICSANHKRNNPKKHEFTISNDNCCIVPKIIKNSKYIPICELIQLENNAPRNLLINLINSIIKNSEIDWKIEHFCKQLIEEMQLNCNNSKQFTLNSSVILKKSKKNPWVIKRIGRNRIEYTIKNDRFMKKVNIKDIIPNNNKLLPDCIVGDNKFIFKTDNSEYMIAINFTQVIDEGIESYIKKTGLDRFNFEAQIRPDLSIVPIENPILAGIPIYSLRYHLCKKVERQNSCVFYFNVYKNLGDNMNEVIDNNDNNFSLLVIMCKFLITCLNGLRTLHKNGYAHRNIKLKNIFCGNMKNKKDTPNHICITNYKKMIYMEPNEIFDYWRYFDINKDIYSTDQTNEIFTDYMDFQSKTNSKLSQKGGGFKKSINTKFLPYYNHLSEIQNILIYQNIDLKMLGVECIKVIEKILGKPILKSNLDHFVPTREFSEYIEILNLIKSFNMLGKIFNSKMKKPLSDFFISTTSNIKGTMYYSLKDSNTIDIIYKYACALISKYNSNPEFNNEFNKFPFVNGVIARDCDTLTSNIYSSDQRISLARGKFALQESEITDDPINAISKSSVWKGKKILKLLTPTKNYNIGYCPGLGFYTYDRRNNPITTYYPNLETLVSIFT